LGGEERSGKESGGGQKMGGSHCAALDTPWRRRGSIDGRTSLEFRGLKLD
jgi:hypothetical protein